MKKILVVEDDNNELKFCVKALRKLNKDIYVVTAHSAEEALSYLNHNQSNIDGAFIDIGLPGIDGFSLAAKIRDMEKYHLLPIVFETATHNDFPETYKQFTISIIL